MTDPAGPMKVTWLPLSDNGYRVADYLGVSYVNGNPFAVFVVAGAKSDTLFREAMYTTAQPMVAPANTLYSSSKDEIPVPDAKSDHPPHDPYSAHGVGPSD